MKMTSWPAHGDVANCDPVAVAKIAIMTGAMDAPYNDRANSQEWEFVRENAERIARWAVEGLAITGRAT